MTPRRLPQCLHRFLKPRRNANHLHLRSAPSPRRRNIHSSIYTIPIPITTTRVIFPPSCAGLIVSRVTARRSTRTVVPAATHILEINPLRLQNLSHRTHDRTDINPHTTTTAFAIAPQIHRHTRTRSRRRFNTTTHDDHHFHKKQKLQPQSIERNTITHYAIRLKKSIFERAKKRGIPARNGMRMRETAQICTKRHKTARTIAPPPHESYHFLCN